MERTSCYLISYNVQQMELSIALKISPAGDLPQWEKYLKASFFYYEWFIQVRFVEGLL